MDDEGADSSVSRKGECQLIFAIELSPSIRERFPQLLSQYVAPLMRAAKNHYYAAVPGNETPKYFMKFGAVLFSNDITAVKQRFLASSIQDFYSYLQQKIPWSLASVDTGRSLNRNRIVEGLVLALEMFQKRKKLILEKMISMGQNPKSLVDEEFFVRHLVLISDSLPWPDIVTWNIMEQYDGIHFNNVTQYIKKDRVHLSIISPRRFPEWEYLITESTMPGDLVFNESLDDHHFVKCSVISLQEAADMSDRGVSSDLTRGRSESELTTLSVGAGQSAPSPPPAKKEAPPKKETEKQKVLQKTEPAPVSQFNRDIWQGMFVISMPATGSEFSFPIIAAISESRNSNADLRLEEWPPQLLVKPLRLELRNLIKLVSQYRLPLVNIRSAANSAQSTSFKRFLEALQKTGSAAVAVFSQPQHGVIFFASKSDLLGVVFVNHSLSLAYGAPAQPAPNPAPVPMPQQPLLSQHSIPMQPNPLLQQPMANFNALNLLNQAQFMNMPMQPPMQPLLNPAFQQNLLGNLNLSPQQQMILLQQLQQQQQQQQNRQ